MCKQFKAFEDKIFEQFVIKENEKNSDEIFSVVYAEKKYWVKKGRKTSSNLFHKICYSILSFEFLIPALTKSYEEAILFESKKLIDFKNKGLNTPEVVGYNNDFFVLADCGVALYSCLKKKNIQSDEFYYYLDKYVLELCKIHNKNLFHGGAQSRNFTYFEGHIYVIDLEDSFDESVDIKTLQFRDLLLLLLSMTKVDNFYFSYEYIIDLYIKNTENKDFIKKLKILSVKLNWLIKLNSISWIHNIFPRDAKGFCKLLEELKKL